jgi:chromosome segregation ATPase
LKAENDQLKSQISSNDTETAAELQKKNSLLKAENDQLKSQILSNGTDEELRTEITELRFDKEALEKKLRKFATHCQRLEDDRAGMAETLRSCNIDVEAHDGDISEAIIHLCDRLTSVEEAHSKRSTKSGSNESSLMKENTSLREKIDIMAQTELKLSEKLNKCHQEIGDLKRALASNGATDEMKQKLSFLEQENLQLMMDIKSLKKQLTSAREENESLRMKVVQNPTDDFSTVDFRFSTTSSKSSSSHGSAVKESSDTMELTEIARGVSVTRPPISKRPRGGALSDASNRRSGNDGESDHSLPDKRQKITQQQQLDKPARKRPNVRPTGITAAPGLGESSSLNNEDHTVECQQS